MKDRDTLIAYLRTCMDAEDWHAVADAACDLREIEAMASGYADGYSVGLVAITTRRADEALDALSKGRS